jgi:lysophospholipase
MGATVLFVPGRGDSLELRESVGARLKQAGYSVVFTEHRGQGGSGRLGAHPDAVHIDSFWEHLAVIEEALVTIQGPVHLLSHSMGGLLSLHLLARHPNRFASAAFSSPMWGFVDAPVWMAAVLSTVASSLGQGKRFAQGEGPFDLRTCLGMRTTSPVSEAVLKSFSQEHRDLMRGGSTWGWVRAASEAMRKLERLPLETITTPTLVVSCARDTTVSLPAQERIAKRLPNATWLQLDTAHDPFFGDERNQEQLWKGIFGLFAPPSQVSANA